MQTQASYCIESLYKKAKDINGVQSLFKRLSHFHIQTNVEIDNVPDNFNPVFGALSNQVSRGLPTRMSYWVEKQFTAAFGEYFEVAEANGVIKSECKVDDDFFKLFKKSLCAIEPRLSANKLFQQYTNSFEALGSKYEEGFLYHKLPKSIENRPFYNAKSAQFISQLLEPQRTMDSIVGISEGFTEQRVDFAYEYPYTKDNINKKGIIVEIDGSQHNLEPQAGIDILRNKAAQQANWDTVRIKTNEFNNEAAFNQKVDSIVAYIQQANIGHFKNLVANANNPLYKTTEGLDALELALSPIAIARIQKTILQFFLCNKLNTDQAEISIVVLERDVPCAYLAIKDLEQQIRNYEILTDTDLLPTIKLKVFNTAEFENAKLNLPNKNKIKLIEEINNSIRYDLLLDVSMFQKVGFTYNHHNINYTHSAIIRNCYSIKSKRSFLTSNHIIYKNFTWLKEEGKEATRKYNNERVAALENILQNIFRKCKFRTGQLPILQRALQAKSVIGLLPTGGGKSLTYQYAVLMQAGISLIIDPIRSLMLDQYRSLTDNYIDACNYINSYLEGEEKRRNQDKLKVAGVLYCFISPERMQMQEFRDVLNDMYENENYFSYCIIDEAHCVSEWGHDFRTPYLRLGSNAIKNCKTKGNKNIPLFGLTATASFDVLADIQRELSTVNNEGVGDNEAVVRSEQSERPELQFKIIEVNAEGQEELDLTQDQINWDFKANLGINKQEKIINLLANIEEEIIEFNNDPSKVFNTKNIDFSNERFEQIQLKDTTNFLNNANTNAGIIFCPHRSWYFGVTDKYIPPRIRIVNGEEITEQRRNGIYDKIRINANNPNFEWNAGTFMGAGDDAALSRTIDIDSTKNQEKFIDEKLNLLVATKAFGMGIDKDNVRFTIHINYPSSIEGFVQESGRAGRDKKLALSYILFNKQTVPIDNDYDINTYFFNKSFKGTGKEKANINELLTKVKLQDKLSLLASLVKDEINIDVRLGINPNGGNHFLNVYGLGRDQQYGGIRLADFNLFINHANIPNPVIVLNTVTSLIENNKPNDLAVLEWLHTTESIDGIKAILDTKSIGDLFDLDIGFQNDKKDRIEKITKWMIGVFPNFGFEENNINQAIGNSEKFSDLVENLEAIPNQNISIKEKCNELDNNRALEAGATFERFEYLYDGIREQADTEKAIYRLTTIGVIDDYTINYRAKTYTLIGVKKKQSDYQRNLKNFILKYYSEKRTNEELENLKYVEGSNLMERCLNFLVEFVYDKVAKKRLRAISDMKEACEIGLDKGNIEFKDYINLYFNSKYARDDYQIDRKEYSLLNDTRGKTQSFTIIDKYIKAIEIDSDAEINNLKHLRGACTRLRRYDTDNFSLQILLAYSIIRLDYKKLLPSISENNNDV